MSFLQNFRVITSACTAHPSEQITSENHCDTAISLLQGKHLHLELQINSVVP